MTETKKTILDMFDTFSLGGDGIGGWLNENTDDEVFTRLAEIDQKPLSRVRLNQLLVFGHESPVSEDFFQYYWLEAPREHPYPVKKLPGFEESFFKPTLETINSLAQLKWGLYRLYTDGLLYFGNVRTAYRELRGLRRSELEAFFRNVHPLTRLIDFKTGVAVGAIVTESEAAVPKLLQRIFENEMEYILEKGPTGSNNEPGPLRLKEVLTGSVIRVQTGNRMLAETFWNHYHGP